MNRIMSIGVVDMEDNRILRSIEVREERLKAADKEALAKVSEACDKMTVEELAAYQGIKSLGQAEGIITEEEALAVYGILGGEVPTTEKWRKRTLAERIVVLELMWELTCAMRLNVGEDGIRTATRRPTTRKSPRRAKRQ
jgi:hypothetical protein